MFNTFKYIRDKLEALSCPIGVAIVKNAPDANKAMVLYQVLCTILANQLPGNLPAILNLAQDKFATTICDEHISAYLWSFSSLAQGCFLPFQHNVYPLDLIILPKKLGT